MAEIHQKFGIGIAMMMSPSPRRTGTDIIRMRNRRSRLTTPPKNLNMEDIIMDEVTNERRFSRYSSRVLSDLRVFSVNNLVILLALINLLMVRKVECHPSPEGDQQSAVENLDSKIRMFLEIHCSMQNETLEQEEFESFMNCGPSHGAGIVKNLRSIPEYKSADTEDWLRGSRRVILTECQMWPQDRKCQEMTFGLIEKCFEKDQKLIFYFNFALTDIICETGRELFLRFWQNGGDTCLVNHLRSLKKDFSDCLEQTNGTTSVADEYRDFDVMMQCFKTNLHKDCGGGDDAREVINEITSEIRRVYRETSIRSGGVASTGVTGLPITIVFLAMNIAFLWRWMTFL